MKTKTQETPARPLGGFDTVAFFRTVKEKLAAKMEGMTLSEKKVFMQKVREGKIKIA